MLDLNNKLNWKEAVSFLKNYMGAYTLDVDNHLSDKAFCKKLIKTMESASNQYSSLTGARYKGPNYDLVYQTDKMRLQRTEELIEKMLITRPLAYETNVFDKWNSDGKGNVLLRAQSARATPLFVGNQNIFHMMAHKNGSYWLGQWYKNRACMPDSIAAYWLNELSDTGQTPLQLFWDETIQALHVKKHYNGMLQGGDFDDISCATTLVLENDWGVLDHSHPKSIASQWEHVKSEADCNGVFSAIDAMITKKNLNNAIKDINADHCAPPAHRKI